MSHLSLDGTLTGDTGVLRLTEDGGTMVLTVGDTEAAQEVCTCELWMDVISIQFTLPK